MHRFMYYRGVFKNRIYTYVGEYIFHVKINYKMSNNRYVALLIPFLKRLKKNGFTGDIDRSLGMCVTLSTDNSIFQVLPDVVLFPKSESDICHVVTLSECPEFKSLRITARGGGTGTNGQSLNRGIVLDCSRYMTGITTLDIENRSVTVQPGVVLSDLNAFLKPHGYFFAPHVSPEDRATLGGMVNTDASGKGSWRYGKTSNHVHSLRCILEDGDILDTADDTQVSSKWEARFHGLGRLLKSNSQIIDQGVSDHYRFFSGYNLKHAIRKETLNLNALMCGSEGTLGIVSQATLSIEPLPQNRMLAVVAYSSFSQALSAAFHLRELKPLAIETMDSTIVTLAQSDPDSMTLLHYYFPKIKEQVVTDQTLCINLIEWVDYDSHQTQKEMISSYFKTHDDHGHDSVVILENEQEISSFWAVRRAGVEHLVRLKGTRKPVPFIEDTLVSPDNLSDYISGLCDILDEYGLTYGMYGHSDVGCIHVRPALDLRQIDDVSILEEVGKRVVKLVKDYNGLLWGEHGKGFRSHYTSYFTTNEFYRLLREVKEVFDPNNRFNPGKIVTPVTKGDQFKFKPQLKGDFDRDIDDPLYQNMTHLVACDGNGRCFSVKKDQLMCPSYQVTSDRRYSPKGRAMMIREWARLKQGSSHQAHRFMREVFESLDLCLSCKACDTACPASVGITRHKTQFLFDYYMLFQRPFKDYVLGFSERLIYWADKRGRLGQWGFERGTDLMRMISLPGLERLPAVSFSPKLQLDGVTWLDHSFWTHQTWPDFPKKSVILLQDMLSKTMHSDIQMAMLKVLSLLGVHVIVAPYFPLGKPLLVKGFIRLFKEEAGRASKKIHRLAALNIPILGIEPSMILALRDDYPEYGIDVPEVHLIQEWLVHQSLPQLKGDNDDQLQLIPHCSEAQAGVSVLWEQVFKQCGQSLTLIQTGCCGMAGSFGLEKSHRRVSEGCFTRFWADHLDQSKRVLASGMSCLQQVKRQKKRYGIDAKVVHPIVYLAEALYTLKT